MRRVYLIRHGHPDFPLGAHMCLGRTDTPLGPLGRMQAALLGEELGGRGLAVYASPLTRCRETAAPLGGTAIPVPALAEQDMGPWDGLDFDTIRARWPELYARRAAQPLLVPPGAETLLQVRGRVLPAFRSCLEKSRGDLAVVVHASVIQAILAELTGTPPEESRALRPPYGSYALLEGEGPRVTLTAQLPRPALTPALAERLLAAAAPGARAEAHCRAVAAESLRIARALPLELNLELLESAALLHDLARGEKDHAYPLSGGQVRAGGPAGDAGGALCRQREPLSDGGGEKGPPGPASGCAGPAGRNQPNLRKDRCRIEGVIPWKTSIGIF